MAKALGSSPEDEYQPNTHLLSKYLNGNVGLLFTDRDPSSIKDYFSTFSKTDFARAGTAATRAFTVPAGIVYSMGGEMAAEDDVTMAHSLEPELRKLNMPTSLVKGKITLENPYTVCEEGDVLDSRQTRLLKLFGVATSNFTVQLVAYVLQSTYLAVFTNILKATGAQLRLKSLQWAKKWKSNFKNMCRFSIIQSGLWPALWPALWRWFSFGNQKNYLARA